MFVIVVQSLSLFATVCDPMDWSTPGFPILHYLLEFAQTHVYWVSDAIQPSHPLSPPSPPALNLSHCQGLFQWVDSSKQKKKPRRYPLISWHRGWSLSSFGRLGAGQGLSTWTWGLTIQLRHKTRTASNHRPFQFCTTTNSAVWTSLGCLAGACTSVSRLEA